LCVSRSRLDRASCHQGSNAGGGDCTTQQGNTHGTEEREVLYVFHPWAGCIVHIREVIKKPTGDVVCCSRDGDGTGRCLELPMWMFDRAACAAVRVGTHPRAGYCRIVRIDGPERQASGDGDTAHLVPSNTYPDLRRSENLSQPESVRFPCDVDTALIRIFEARRDSSICSPPGLSASGSAQSREQRIAIRHAREVSRFARNSRDWQQLIEMTGEELTQADCCEITATAVVALTGACSD
jgi:hypothetical protein